MLWFTSVLLIFTDLWSQILADIAHYGIQIFQPFQYENEDEETIQENEEIIVCPLFTAMATRLT